jgi:hypothetical protein
MRMRTGAWFKVPWKVRGFLVKASLRLLISMVVPAGVV